MRRVLRGGYRKQTNEQDKINSCNNKTLHSGLWGKCRAQSLQRSRFVSAVGFSVERPAECINSLHCLLQVTQCAGLHWRRRGLFCSPAADPSSGRGSTHPPRCLCSAENLSPCPRRRLDLEPGKAKMHQGQR